jgi:hypothetical protein
MMARVLSYPKRCALVALALISAHCGARGALSVEAGAGGGGTTSTSSGTGGGAPLCKLWDQTASWTWTGFTGATSAVPELVPVRADESRYAFTVLGQTDAMPLYFWHAPVEPWSAPNGEFVDLQGTYIYSLASPDYGVAPSAVEDAYVLTTTSATPPSVGFNPAITPGSSDPGEEQAFDTQQPGAPRPLFAARRPATVGEGFEHLVGYEMLDGARRRTIVSILSPTWSKIEHTQAVSCADRPIAARAVGVSNVFFIATGSSRAVGQCDDPSDAFGAPTRVQVTFYNQPLGVVLNPVAEWQEQAPVERVAITLGEGSLWITYALTIDAERASLRVARVDLTGTVLLDPVEIATIARPAAFASARLGSRLAVAARALTDTGQTTVPVRILAPDGAVEQSFTIVPEAADEVAMVAHPDGSHLLVALTRRGTSGPPVWLGRFDCH